MPMNDATIERMTRAARECSERAYSPYSNFAVGAAALTTTGEVIAACNVENASYGLTICAERSAIFSMVATGHSELQGLVIYTPTERPTSPCGACRQVINEFGPDARIVCVCDGTERIDMTLDKLFPEGFGPRNLRSRDLSGKQSN